jgi:ribosomal protein S8
MKSQTFERINERAEMLNDDKRRSSLEQWLRTPIIEAVVAFANKKHTIKQVSVYSLINSLNMAVKHNQVFTVCYVNDYLLSVLQLFKKQGFVYDYLVLPESYYNVLSLCGLSPAFSNRLCVVYLRYGSEHGLSLRHVKLLSKPSRQLYVSLDGLRRMVKLDSVAEVYILNTVKGVMTHNEAMEEKIGGNVIALVT